MTLTELIKDNTVHFASYRSGQLFYKIEKGGFWMVFPIPITDTGNGNFQRDMKAITLMRWIRKEWEANKKRWQTVSEHSLTFRPDE